MSNYTEYVDEPVYGTWNETKNYAEYTNGTWNGTQNYDEYTNGPSNNTQNYDEYTYGPWNNTQNYDYEYLNGTTNGTSFVGDYLNGTLESLKSQSESEESLAVQIIWFIGIVISSLCLILQIVLVIIRPKLRKLDQKILIQLTVARLMNSIMELLMTYQYFDDYYTKDPVFALYLQTDAVLVCWMFVFTKNLYDKVVVVFVTKRFNFLLLSVLIWVLTIPIGILCPVSLMNDFYVELYKSYAWVKFIVLTMNLLFFGRIFRVIITRSNTPNRNMKDIIKTCIISFLLVILTSLQVFVNDILSYLEVTAVSEAFCLINSFQVVPATVIFLILAQNCN